MRVLRNEGINCGGKKITNSLEELHFGVEICGNAVGEKRKSEKVMAIVITLGKEGMQTICEYGPQIGKADTKKVKNGRIC